MATASANVTITNRLGLHARPAMMFVDTASTFGCDITVTRTDNPEEKIDGKSIMQMMMLAATMGTELKIDGEGDDCQEAVDALVALVKSNFEEE